MTGRNASSKSGLEGGVVAMDCEMVGVGPDGSRSILARVSIVDWQCNVLFDTFVKVEEKVTDYRTFISGVRPGDLCASSGAMDFGTVRNTVQRIIHNKILVGHGLKNDLKVLNISHPWYLTRDSATYEPLLRPNLQPRRLKELAQTEAGLIIQQDGREHNSIEDAKASIAIYMAHHVGWEHAVRCHLVQVHYHHQMSV
jgi:RNA exonuclease 4